MNHSLVTKAHNAVIAIHDVCGHKSAFQREQIGVKVCR